MAKLEDVLPAFRAGKKIKLKSWGDSVYLHRDQLGVHDSSYVCLLLDWEIVEDEKPKEIIQDISSLELAGMNLEQVLELKRFYQMHHAELPNRHSLTKKTKTVWQWRFKGETDDRKYNWCLYEKLLTEDEALMTLNCYKYEKHSGPYEVLE